MDEFKYLDSNCNEYTYGCKICCPNSPKNIVNIVRNYCSTNIWSYSDWIDCASLDKYYYFVQNLGNSPIEAYIEISPDKTMVFRDSDQIIVNSLQVSYFQPLRESHYIRFSFKSINNSDRNLIKAWFQGKKI
jgi:hypothetical protein